MKQVKGLQAEICRPASFSSETNNLNWTSCIAKNCTAQISAMILCAICTANLFDGSGWNDKYASGTPLQTAGLIPHDIVNSGPEQSVAGAFSGYDAGAIETLFV
jgi:hypothetical protein